MKPATPSGKPQRAAAPNKPSNNDLAPAQSLPYQEGMTNEPVYPPEARDGSGVIRDRTSPYMAVPVWKQMEEPTECEHGDVRFACDKCCEAKT